MNKILPAFAASLMLGLGVSAQTFTESVLPFEELFNSGGCVGVSDMNQDGFDDVVILDQSRNVYIQYQNSDGTFTQAEYGSLSGANQWGFSIGDYDHNGHNDLVSGGNFDGVHYFQILDIGDYNAYELDDNGIFMQGCSTGDVDNDGFLDVFGCNDVGISRIWGNDGSGNLSSEPDWIDMVTTPESDNSGNYGSVFCDVDGDDDLDLFIAKCRQGVTDPNDPRRINALFLNNGDGTFTGNVAPERGLAPLKQTWTSDFADMDNDGDFDAFMTNHDYSLMIFENDGNGNFTDITASTGVENEFGFFLQGKFEDFDNDGFVDLLYAGETEGYFHNNGDMTFTKFTNKLPYGDALHSFALGDLNKDGWVDVYASYGNTYVNPDNSNPDKLWLNDGGTNNWVAFDLEGTISNVNAIGAKVKIYGDWGVQVREVRSGESYGIVCSQQLRFGLGESTEITSAEIIFPSGEVMTIDEPEINTYHEVIEGCVNIPNGTVTSSGPTVICNGETVTLNLSTDAMNVIWSNGDVGSTITVSEAGDYFAEIWDDEECVGSSNHIFVDVYEPQQPTVEVTGQFDICEGDFVTLQASEGVAYSWSNGGNESVNYISESGTYAVTVTDECNNEDTSEEVEIELNVFPVPETPSINDIEILSGQSATFVVGEENAYWFDSETSEDPIATGMSFTTPVLNSSTSYWVEYGNSAEPVAESGGKLEPSNGQYHPNSDYHMKFSAYEDVVIKEVTVDANGEDTRTIFVANAQGDIIATGDFLIPDGVSVVELNFSVPAGDNYSIETVGNPQLWRDQSDDNLPYPYLIGDILSIDATSIQSGNWNNYYYFFYDWKVESEPFVCSGERVEATAVVVGIEEIDFINSFSLFPLPAKDNVMAQIEATSSKIVSFEIRNTLGQLVQENTNKVINPGMNQIEFNVLSLSTGIYYLNMTVEGKMVTKKLVVNK